jgi:ubiquinone/menaquinone biosynthesis C-methylase UbiE
MRYAANELLQKIRESFRKESLPYAGKNILEIGFGPGLDLIYFSRAFPDAKIFGIDLSEEMYDQARDNIERHKLKNVLIERGSVEDISKLFPGQQFDFIYVYFGALNTVENLEMAATFLKEALCPAGHLVVTFINKYYLSLFLKNLLQGRFKKAVARLKTNWGGYSPYRFLKSRCYSYREIRAYFKGFQMIRKRGYSIVYPAWYSFQKYQGKKLLQIKLWAADKFLNKTFFWQYGEYCLYIMKKSG